LLVKKQKIAAFGSAYTQSEVVQNARIAMSVVQNQTGLVPSPLAQHPDLPKVLILPLLGLISAPLQLHSFSAE
jgi:hypothetical protein